MENNRNILVLATVLSIFFGFIPALILWFVMKEKFDSAQKAYLNYLLNFELTLLFGGIICMIIKSIPILGFIGSLGLAILWLINAIYVIKAVITLSKDETPQFTFALNLIK